MTMLSDFSFGLKLPMFWLSLFKGHRTKKVNNAKIQASSIANDLDMLHVPVCSILSKKVHIPEPFFSSFHYLKVLKSYFRK